MQKICGRCSSPVRGKYCPVCGYDCESAEESVALKAGTVLDQRYVLGRVIGSGGFGITYLAYDTEEEKTVAIKEYYPKGVALRGEDNFSVEPYASAQADEFRKGMESFRREAEILSGLDADVVMKIFGTFSQNGTVYYVMKYVHGITLKEYVSQNGKITEGQALYAAREAAATFEAIHERNVIHRDLSPNNVMIDMDGRFRIVDFGNARQFFAKEGKSMTVNLKPGFAPLEQYQRHGNQGPWTDLYSLGMVLYYGLTLKVPEDPMARLDDDRIFQEELSRMNPRLAAVLEKLCQVKVQERYACVQELSKALDKLKIVPEHFRAGD